MQLNISIQKWGSPFVGYQNFHRQAEALLDVLWQGQLNMYLAQSNLKHPPCYQNG